jgi:hypothetical protein
MVTDLKDARRKSPVRVLKNALVTKVDQLDSRQEGGMARPQVNSVSLAVSDEDAFKLKLFEDTGVSIVLRGEKQTYDDKEKTGFDIDLAAMFGIGAKPEEPKVEEKQELKTEKVLIAKKTLKLNEKITSDNFNEYFEQLEILSKLPNEPVLTQSDALNKFLASPLTAGQIVFKDILSDKEVEVAPKTELKREPVVEKKRHRVVLQQGTETIEIVYEEDGKGGWKKVEANSGLTNGEPAKSDKDAKEPKSPEAVPPTKPTLDSDKKERVTLNK